MDQKNNQEIKLARFGNWMWGKAKESVNNVSLIFTLNNQMALGEIGTIGQ